MMSSLVARSFCGGELVGGEVTIILNYCYM